MNIENIRCDGCPINSSCEAYQFFIKRMAEMTAEIISLRMDKAVLG